MKRCLTFAVVALLGLSACSGEKTPETPAAAPSSAATGHEHHQTHSSGAAPSGAPGGTLVVHVADALRPTISVLVPKFEEAFPGIKVAIEWGAGAEHVDHVLGGMPVDVFVSADKAAIDKLNQGHVRGAPAVVARNPIVIAVPETTPVNKIAGVADLSGARVALCAETTDCGRNSRAALAAASVKLKSEAIDPDAATALTRVRAGAADAALVYRTDVTAAGNGLRAVDFAQANRLADQYTAVSITTGLNKVGADAFLSFLSSSLARIVFAESGLAPA